MEADTKIHSKSLDLALGVLVKKARRNCISLGVKVITREPTETAAMILWELKDTEPTVRSGPMAGI